MIEGEAGGAYLPGRAGKAQTNIATAARQITKEESGSVIFLNSATEFALTLPSPELGLRYTIVVKAAPSGASYTVVTYGSSNIIVGCQFTAQDAGGSGDSGTADDTITFVDGNAVAGDKVELISDGTYWYAYAFAKVVAGITFTQAS